MEGMAEVVLRYGGLLVMDCMTSLGGVPVTVDAWDIDIAYSGTQKCLSCPPGSLDSRSPRTRGAPPKANPSRQLVSGFDGA